MCRTMCRCSVVASRAAVGPLIGPHHTEILRCSSLKSHNYYWSVKYLQTGPLPPPSLHTVNTSPIFSLQASTQVLSDAQPGAVKNNNMSKKLTTAETTENGTRLGEEKHCKLCCSALGFVNSPDPRPTVEDSGSEEPDTQRLDLHRDLVERPRKVRTQHQSSHYNAREITFCYSFRFQTCINLSSVKWDEQQTSGCCDKENKR